jgi:hypothetical protein
MNDGAKVNKREAETSKIVSRRPTDIIDVHGKYFCNII